MNLLSISKKVLKVFDDKYAQRAAMRYRLADDSVILMCGLIERMSFFFEVQFAIVPIYSSFSLEKGFLTNITGYPVFTFEQFKDTPPLSVRPDLFADTINLTLDDVLNTASAMAEFAFNELEKIHTMSDCFEKYRSEYSIRLKDGKRVKPQLRHQLLDMLIFYGMYDECISLIELNQALCAEGIFRMLGEEYPGDGEWRKYLPKSLDKAQNALETNLWHCHASRPRCYDLIKRGEYTPLFERLYANYKANKAALKKLNLHLGDAVERRILESLRNGGMII